MTHLRHESCFNPYLIANGKEVNNIIFFRKGKILAEVGAGWFGNNHIDVAELNDIEFSRALKVNLNRDDSFYINNNKDNWDKNRVAIYINLDNVPSILIEPLGELVAAENSESIYYGEFFNITATFAGERKLIKTMKRTYSRVEKKTKRLNKEAFTAFINARDGLDLRINSYDAGKIFDNIDGINEFLTNLPKAA